MSGWDSKGWSSKGSNPRTKSWPGATAPASSGDDDTDHWEDLGDTHWDDLDETTWENMKP